MICARLRRVVPGCAVLALVGSAPNANAQTVGFLPGQSDYQARVGRGVLDTCLGLFDHATLGGRRDVDDLFTRCSELVVTGFFATGFAIGESAFDLGFDVNELLRALEDVGHDEFATAGADSINVMTSTIGVLETRMVALREGATGISLAGLGFVDSLGRRHDGADLERALREDSAAGSVLGERLGLFINGFGNWAEFDGTSEEAGFDTSEGGFVTGLDYRFTDELVAGVALGTAFSDSDLHGIGRGDLDRLAVSGSLYATWQRGGFYVDGIASYSRNAYHLDREIRYLGRTAEGNTDADEWAGALGAGYDFQRGAWRFGPYVRAEYIDVSVDGFTEDGARGLDLRYRSTDIQSFVTDLGVRAEYALSTGFGVVTPYARAAWKHEFENDSRRLAVTFAADPAQLPFFLVTRDPDRDYASLGLGAALALQGGWSAFADFDALVGLRDSERYTLTVGARLQF